MPLEPASRHPNLLWTKLIRKSWHSKLKIWGVICCDKFGQSKLECQLSGSKGRFECQSVLTSYSLEQIKVSTCCDSSVQSKLGCQLSGSKGRFECQLVVHVIISSVQSKLECQLSGSQGRFECHILICSGPNSSQQVDTQICLWSQKVDTLICFGSNKSKQGDTQICLCNQKVDIESRMNCDVLGETCGTSQKLGFTDFPENI